jgi:hypothetical protein
MRRAATAALRLNAAAGTRHAHAKAGMAQRAGTLLHVYAVRLHSTTNPAGAGAAMPRLSRGT